MFKTIKANIKRAIGSEKEFSFEVRLINAYVLYGGIMCFLSIFFNQWLGLGIGLSLLMVISIIFLGVTFYLGRIKRKVYVSKLLFSVYTLLFCNLFWFMNYGSQGSATYIFLVYFFIMIFAWDNFQIKVIGIIIFLNILVLFALEVSIPGLIPSYPSETARIMDSYATLAIVLGFFAIIIVNAKNNYIRQYKAARQADKLKSAFLANMSHEIRTPLNAIIGFSQLLIERDLAREKKERYSNLITENGDYLMKLISDIMDVSMIESGHLNIVTSRVNLNKMFNQIFVIHSEVIKQKLNHDLRIIVEIPEQTVYVTTDELRLKQIVLNLINNALKYTTKGYIKFGFTEKETEILFYVEDTGCGIKEEFQHEVFNRFVRHEEIREVKTTRGSGIGLSLSKDLVTVLGGKIWFTSQFNHGSNFYFTLPVQKQSPSALNSGKIS